MHHVVLALAPDEVNHRDLPVGGEPADRGDEPIRDCTERGRRGDPQAELALEVADDPLGELQLGHVDVEVHPVDALHLEAHVTGQDVGDRAG